MKHPPVTVRMLGPLYTFRKKCGLSPSVEITVPSEGIQAIDIVQQIGLPQEKVGHVFCNNTAYGLEHLIRPGDRIAFVSPWFVGKPHKPSHRSYLGGPI